MEKHAEIMEITCINGRYWDGDFEDGKCIIHSTLAKKDNPVLCESILTDLIKIKDLVVENENVEEEEKYATNMLIVDPTKTKRVRIDVSAECEYLRKNDENYTSPDDILTALKFQTFVEDS